MTSKTYETLKIKFCLYFNSKILVWNKAKTARNLCSGSQNLVSGSCGERSPHTRAHESTTRTAHSHAAVVLHSATDGTASAEPERCRGGELQRHAAAHVQRVVDHRRSRCVCEPHELLVDGVRAGDLPRAADVYDLLHRVLLRPSVCV